MRQPWHGFGANAPTIEHLEIKLVVLSSCPVVSIFCCFIKQLFSIRLYPAVQIRRGPYGGVGGVGGLGSVALYRFYSDACRCVFFGRTVHGR